MCWFRGLTQGCSHKHDQGHMEAHQVHLGRYRANEVKFVININIVKGALSADFNDVPELIVKHCVQFITVPLVHIFHSSFPTEYFVGILKRGEIQPMVKKFVEQCVKKYRAILFLLFNFAET